MLQGASRKKPNHKPSGKKRPETISGPEAKPGNDDSPFADKPAPPPEPDPPPKPAEPKKVKTPEELDQLLADAKTPEDYLAAAGEALRAVGKALDDHQQDAVKPLILKALVAARKSGDAKLIVKVTRVLAKPELVKEILAEMDNQGQDPAAVPDRLRM